MGLPGGGSALLAEQFSSLLGLAFVGLTVARMSQDDLALLSAATTAAINSFIKAGMATFIGGRHIGFRVGLALLGRAIGGLVSVCLWAR